MAKDGTARRQEFDYAAVFQLVLPMAVDHFEQQLLFRLPSLK